MKTTVSMRLILLIYYGYSMDSIVWNVQPIGGVYSGLSDGIHAATVVTALTGSVPSIEFDSLMNSPINGIRPTVDKPYNYERNGSDRMIYTLRIMIHMITTRLKVRATT